MSHRPLALVFGLTLGDYLLWNWSLSGGHDVVALVSGLTLPPLAVGSVWLLALTLVRLLARATDRSERQIRRDRTARHRTTRRRAARQAEDATRPSTAAPADGPSSPPRPPPTSSQPDSASRTVSDRIRRPLPHSKRGRLWLAGLLVLVLAAVSLGGYVYERNRTGNVYHPHARFVPEPVPSLPAHGPARFAWPFYGYTKEHTRFFPASATLHPPFRQRWERNDRTLLEFPPVIYGDHIFQLGDDGVLNAINKHTGHTFWSRRLGTLSASSPAAVGSTVYATVLDRGAGSSSGRVVALNYANGSIRWSRNLSSPSESSPLLDHGKLFFGSQNGTVYALNASNGSVLWTYHAAGAVKASPTLSGGVLYFGDYSGHLQAISEQTGRRLWISGSGGALLGSGTFYSTAAVDYGRVFLGNTDGRVYAYDASTGRLDWAVQTGAFVYASPAITNAPGLGPTIYVGSYSGTFYALNARSGQIAWRYNAHGRISGSATIVGRTVYFADLGQRRTYGLGISTGRVSFEKDTGAFDPVVSDGENIYLTGYTGLYALVPRP